MKVVCRCNMAASVVIWNCVMDRSPLAFQSTKIFFERCHCVQRRFFNSKVKRSRFGFLFDIDGVIVRGKRLLPSAKDAFRLLSDENRNTRVPTLFVTNAGNTLRQNKAQQLSQWLNIKVNRDQVIMSHSPLKMFKQFHDKHVLVSGQGSVYEIATRLGFTRVSTVDMLRHCFTNLDMVDHRRRKSAPCAFETYFPRIEAVILFGEPVRWETNLQLIVDVLMTNGLPVAAPRETPYPHLPVLACNMDLLWMAEASMPRFGHGCFLHCLESLYQKISGRELKYTALIGKPSELTYHHADYMLGQQAKSLGMDGIDTIYCIGDNPETDIYGANLFNRHLQKKAIQKKKRAASLIKQKAATQNAYATVTDETDSDLECELDYQDEDSDEGFATTCQSVIVCTGVYSSERDYVTYAGDHISHHNHRDFVLDPELKQPTYMVDNVLEAVKLIFKKESF